MLVFLPRVRKHLKYTGSGKSARCCFESDAFVPFGREIGVPHRRFGGFLLFTLKSSLFLLNLYQSEGFLNHTGVILLELLVFQVTHVSTNNKGGTQFTDWSTPLIGRADTCCKPVAGGNHLFVAFQQKLAKYCYGSTLENLWRGSSRHSVSSISRCTRARYGRFTAVQGTVMHCTLVPPQGRMPVYKD